MFPTRVDEVCPANKKCGEATIIALILVIQSQWYQAALEREKGRGREEREREGKREEK